MPRAAPAVDPLTVPDAWNAVATAYDEELSPRAPELVEEAITTLAPDEAATVLDVATGPGALAMKLAPRVRRVVAIDFAASMIARLNAKIAQANLAHVVETHVMDGHALTFADASFDEVVSMFGWFLFADRARGLAEMRRVLRPGGRLLVTSWLPPDRNTVLGVPLEAMRAALPELPRPAGPLPTQIPEVCAGEVRDAGFVEVAARPVVVKVELESAAECWRLFERAGAPVALLKKKLGETAWKETSARAFALLCERVGTGRVTLDAAAIFTSARCPGAAGRRT